MLGLALEEARSLLARIDALPERVAAASQGRTGTLTLGLVSGAVLSGVASRLIRTYRTRFPKVAVRVHAVLHAPLVRMLREGEVDAAVFGSSLGDPSLVGEPLVRESFVVALPAEHRLATRKLVRYRDLAGETLVVLMRDTAPGLFTNILSTCAQHGFEPAAIEEAAGEDAVMGLVAAGVGVAIVPDSWAAIRIPGAVTRRLSPAGAGATLRLFHRADNDSRLVRAMVECAKAI